jgi:hypothetical protein
MEPMLIFYFSDSSTFNSYKIIFCDMFIVYVCCIFFVLFLSLVFNRHLD